MTTYHEFHLPCFVVETTYGSYPVGTWVFCTQRDTLELAVEFCKQQKPEDAYRVVDLEGVVLYSDPNKLTSLLTGYYAVELTEEQHQVLHENLHNALDLLVADYIHHSDKLLADTSVLELLEWSASQTVKPTVKM